MKLESKSSPRGLMQRRRSKKEDLQGLNRYKLFLHITSHPETNSITETSRLTG